MARPLRIEYEGAFYHVIQRGIERKHIFASNGDKDKFLSYLSASSLSYKAIHHSYVFMDNHYHLIIETPLANLSKIMHYLNTSYAAYFNAKHERVGPLYQGRYKAILIQKDEYLHHLSSYIHLNPVRAGIVKSPDEYTYSSYKFFTSNNEPPQWLNTGLILSMFNKVTLKAKKLYAQFVINNIGNEADVITSNMKNGIILGDEEFYKDTTDKFVANKEDTEIPALKSMRHINEPSLEYIKDTVERHIQYDKRLSRSVSVYLSRKYTRRTLIQIAAFYGEMQYTAVSQVWRRVEKRREDDKGFDKMLTGIEHEIVSSVKT